MSEKNINVQIKMDHIEFSYEGDKDFLTQDLPEFMDCLAKLHHKVPAITHEEDDKSTNAESSKSSNTSTGNVNFNGTVNTYAAKIGVDSGPDLVLATVAQAIYSNGQDTISRKEIADNMKTATSYYKPTYNSNLSKYLQRLIKNNALVENKKNVYALSASMCKKIEGIIKDE